MDLVESEADFIPDYEEEVVEEVLGETGNQENIEPICAIGGMSQLKRRKRDVTGGLVKEERMTLLENQYTSLNVVNIPVSGKGRVGRLCPLCEAPVKNLRRHVSQDHLPWYFHPEVTCWSCQSYQGTLCFLRHRHLSQSICS